MQVTIKKTGNGVNKDLLASELLPGQWSDCLNVRFRNDFAETFKGIQQAYTPPPVIPYWMDTYGNAGNRFVVYAGLQRAFVDDGGTQTEITRIAGVFTGARDDRWSGGVLNGVLLMNNPVNGLFYWGGNIANKLLAVPGYANVADVARPFKNFVVFLGSTVAGVKKPHNVAWSASASPGAIPTSFVSSATNDAGETDLAETTGSMVDCLPLGNVNIIYKQDARYAMQYVGGNDVFSFQRLPGNDGLLARGCVVQTPKGHVFLTNGDVKIHSGGEAVSIADGRIRKWLFNTMDAGNAPRSFLCLNPQKTEVWLVFPSVGSADCNTVIAWNWDADAWGIRAVSGVTCGVAGLVSVALTNGSYASQTSTYAASVEFYNSNQNTPNEARLIIGNNTPKLGLAETGSNDFGVAFTWMLERVGMELDDPESIKVLSASRPHFNALPGTLVSIYHGSSMFADAIPTYAAPTNFTTGTTNWANMFAQGGRYLSLKMTSIDPQPVSLRSFDIDFTKQGRF